MAKSDSLLSVVVPTKNSAGTLERCLRSIRSQSYPFIEVIVVDNYSLDSTREIATQLADQVLVCGPERSMQRNYGASAASGLYLLMIDSDMELSANVAGSCVKVLDRDPDVAAVVIPEESFGDGFWSRCKQLERSFYVGVPWIEAARCFRKTSYEAVGGYDADLISGEDWDLASRVARIGAIGRVAELIYHNEGHITLRRTLRKKFYYARNAGAFLDQNPEKSLLLSQVGPLKRYALFFSKPKRLLGSPLVGAAMLFMKSGEFIVGGLGYLLSRSGRGKWNNGGGIDAENL